MVDVSVHHTTTGDTDTDTGACCYCCSDSYAHSSRTNSNADTRRNGYTYAGTYLRPHTDVVADFDTLSIRKCGF